MLGATYPSTVHYNPQPEFLNCDVSERFGNFCRVDALRFLTFPTEKSGLKEFVTNKIVIESSLGDASCEREQNDDLSPSDRFVSENLVGEQVQTRQVFFRLKKYADE